MISHEHGKWVLRSKDGSKVLGRYASRSAAEARERQVNYFKHARHDERDDMAARRALRKRIMDAIAKRRPRPIARPPHPNGVELQMRRTLLHASRAMDTAVMSALRAAGVVRKDAAADGGAPTIDLSPEDRKRLTNALRRRLRSIASQKSLVGALDRVANSAVDFTRAQWRKQLQNAIGIDLTADPDLAPLIDEFRRLNVDRIVALADEKVDRVERVLREAGPGARVETVQKRIAEQTGASESHAMLIARTETTSLCARMTKARHEAAGIKEFVWSTSRDERVRPTHAALEGRRFAYDDLPLIPGEGAVLPGAIYNCRCVAIAHIPGFDDE